MNKRNPLWKRLLSKLCYNRTMKAQFLFLDGAITEQERNEMMFFWQTIKAKWVRGECHHLCKFCDYKHECWSNAKE